MKKYVDVTLEVLLNSLVLSFLGAMIRILFTKLEKFVETFRMFTGSILFGLVSGYSLNDFTILKPYMKVIVVLFSIFGKEMFVWLEHIFKNPAKHLSFFVRIIQVFQNIKININKPDDEHNTN